MKKESILIKKLLYLSSELEKTYWWKEDLIEWYDCCINVSQATSVFDKWLCLGKLLNIPEIDIVIKTFENWK